MKQKGSLAEKGECGCGNMDEDGYVRDRDGEE